MYVYTYISCMDVRKIKQSLKSRTDLTFTARLNVITSWSDAQTSVLLWDIISQNIYVKQSYSETMIK